MPASPAPASAPLTHASNGSGDERPWPRPNAAEMPWSKSTCKDKFSRPLTPDTAGQSASFRKRGITMASSPARLPHSPARSDSPDEVLHAETDPCATFTCAGWAAAGGAGEADGGAGVVVDSACSSPDPDVLGGGASPGPAAAGGPTGAPGRVGPNRTP